MECERRGRKEIGCQGWQRNKARNKKNGNERKSFFDPFFDFPRSTNHTHTHTLTLTPPTTHLSVKKIQKKMCGRGGGDGDAEASAEQEEIKWLLNNNIDFRSYRNHNEKAGKMSRGVKS